MSVGIASVRPAVNYSPSELIERRHRLRLSVGYGLAVIIVIGLAAYGFSYYTLPMQERPFSERHQLLKPTGTIGLNLGVMGFALFFAIFVYPLRKHWPWLHKQGSSRHWLDIHVLMGLTAPFIIAFHASFKFQGLAGLAFWIMVAVSASGVIGRYVYGQIPRRVSTAELSLGELQDRQTQLSVQLREQKLLPALDLDHLLRMPKAKQVTQMPLLGALALMFGLDLALVFRIARLRRHALGWGARILTFGGLLRTRHHDLERAITTAREQARLSKRVLFLSRAQQVFHLWHIVHKPFSYSFAVLALVHIMIAMLAGYVPWR